MNETRWTPFTEELLAAPPSGGSAVPVRETHDGLPVPKGYRLRFCPLEATYEGWSGVLFSLAVEWNRDGTQRRPYLVWDLGPVHGQTGWLWEGPARPSVEEAEAALSRARGEEPTE